MLSIPERLPSNTALPQATLDTGSGHVHPAAQALLDGYLDSIGHTPESTTAHEILRETYHGAAALLEREPARHTMSESAALVDYQRAHGAIKAMNELIDKCADTLCPPSRHAFELLNTINDPTVEKNHLYNSNEYFSENPAPLGRAVMQRLTGKAIAWLHYLSLKQTLVEDIRDQQQDLTGAYAVTNDTTTHRNLYPQDLPPQSRRPHAYPNELAVVLAQHSHLLQAMRPPTAYGDEYARRLATPEAEREQLRPLHESLLKVHDRLHEQNRIENDRQFALELRRTQNRAATVQHNEDDDFAFSPEALARAADLWHCVENVLMCCCCCS